MSLRRKNFKEKGEQKGHTKRRKEVKVGGHKE